MTPAHVIHTGEQAIERLGGLPGGPELLAQARRREDIALVGGAVRDLLLGHWPRELDVVVDHDSAGLAAVLAATLSPSERAYGHPVQPTLHERFGTASLHWQYGRIDIAQRRAESYPSPGALPEVRPGDEAEDLARRDFTVNAIALPLGGPQRGRLAHFDGALEDLAAGRMRVLHQRSFIDDPTRLLRLARYAARLRFDIEPDTLALAREAVADGALDTISGGRIGAELWLAAREADDGAFAVLGEDLSVLAALGLPSYDRDLAREARAIAPSDADPALLAMAVLLHPTGDDGAEARAGAQRLMDHLEFPAEARERILDSAFGLADLAAGILAARAASQLHELLAGRPVEAAALAGALAARQDPAARQAVERWLAELRHVRLSIDGSDLLAAGVPEGPDVGRRLRQALADKLDGRIDGSPEQELQAALQDRP